MSTLIIGCFLAHCSKFKGTAIAFGLNDFELNSQQIVQSENTNRQKTDKKAK